MKIDCLVLGDFQTNCYVLRRDMAAKDCLIIDPGLQARALLDFLATGGLEPVAVILTHGHIDHIAGISLLRQRYPGIQVCIHPADADMLTEPTANLSLLTGEMFTDRPADILLDGDGDVEFAGVRLKVLHTPGHTPGGICLYSPQDAVVFTDDALFADSIGRTDFPGGDTRQLLQAIRQRLLTLPAETVVYPGHGSETTIAAEKAHNPFL
ncbi:MAG TPA: MBL fold metallo-hydrolase [Phycisphaerales bacterium]|mgnify:CR=1 FL=1|nr:MBL fold metallo-hydrolase [Phycisphaerales bacterium]